MERDQASWIELTMPVKPGRSPDDTARYLHRRIARIADAEGRAVRGDPAVHVTLRAWLSSTKEKEIT
jgi:hypothetical protein